MGRRVTRRFFKKVRYLIVYTHLKHLLIFRLGLNLEEKGLYNKYEDVTETIDGVLKIKEEYISDFNELYFNVKGVRKSVADFSPISRNLLENILLHSVFRFLQEKPKTLSVLACISDPIAKEFSHYFIGVQNFINREFIHEIFRNGCTLLGIPFETTLEVPQSNHKYEKKLQSPKRFAQSGKSEIDLWWEYTHPTKELDMTYEGITKVMEEYNSLSIWPTINNFLLQQNISRILLGAKFSSSLTESIFSHLGDVCTKKRKRLKHYKISTFTRLKFMNVMSRKENRFKKRMLKSQKIKFLKEKNVENSSNSNVSGSSNEESGSNNGSSVSDESDSNGSSEEPILDEEENTFE